MEESHIRKLIVVDIILVFLSTTCLPVLANEDKPDLVATDIYQDSYNEFYPVYYIFVKVANIGNASVNDSIHFHVTAQRLLFGILPLKSITFEGNYKPDFDFHPGLQCYCVINYNHTLFGIPFSFYKLNCTINPHKTIEEINYNNNYIEKKYFFGYPFR